MVASAREAPLSPILELAHFGVAFAKQLVLTDISLEVAPTGVHTVLGPAGTGKSTLVRTLAGLNDKQPSLRVWGDVTFAGEPLSNANRPALVSQHASLLTSTVLLNLGHSIPDRSTLTLGEQKEIIVHTLEEQGLGDAVDDLDRDVLSLSTRRLRQLALVRAMLSRSPLLMIDEPTATIGADEATPISRQIAHIAKTHAVLLITHDQRLARVLGGDYTLIAGGCVQEQGKTEAFFAGPQTAAGRSFLKTGNCRVASPGAKREDLSTSIPPPSPVPQAAVRILRAPSGPRNFYWILAGILGGTPRPGTVEEVDDDIEALARIGVRVLVTLEERRVIDADLLAQHRIESYFLPIEDMGVPTIEDTEALCRKVDVWTQRALPVAMHCLAGHGRTGTMLACCLVWQGATGLEAIDQVRRAQPRAIQSRAQVEFVNDFSKRRDR